MFTADNSLLYGCFDVILVPNVSPVKCITSMCWYLLLSVMVSHDSKWGQFLFACPSLLDLCRIAAAELWWTFSTICPGIAMRKNSQDLEITEHIISRCFHCPVTVWLCRLVSNIHLDFNDLMWLPNIEHFSIASPAVVSQDGNDCRLVFRMRISSCHNDDTATAGIIGVPPVLQLIWLISNTKPIIHVHRFNECNTMANSWPQRTNHGFATVVCQRWVD